MATVERTALVDAAPDQIWDVLSDFGAISRWAPNVNHSCLMTEQEHGIGAVRRIQASGATVLETVAPWEPGVGLSYEIMGLPSVIKKVTNTWRLATSGPQTVVSLTSEVDAGHRPPQQLVAKVVGRKLGEASDQMLTGLAGAVERAETEIGTRTNV